MPYLKEAHDGAMVPMSSSEMLAFYHQLAEDDVTILADLYLDFADLDRPTFGVFKDRLCSAILLARAVTTHTDEMSRQCTEHARTGSHRIKGWEGESDMMLEERQALGETAATIARGAATLTAVAAFESLLDDLLPPDVQPGGGLLRKWAAVLRDYQFPEHETVPLTTQVRDIGQRRNTFAHELTGSYWPKNTATATTPAFDEASLDDTLHTVGRLAVALESLIDRYAPAR
jgi:hypothetical protein